MITRMFQRILFLLFLALPLGASADDENFSDIFIFGDSLSDNGNLPDLLEFLGQPEGLALKSFPYDNGLSNGPRAIDILAEELGLTAAPSQFAKSFFFPPDIPFVPEGTNYAVAGARAVIVPDGLPIDLPLQILKVLEGQGGIAPSDALYLVFIGGNDIRDARTAWNNGDKNTAVRIIRDAVMGIDDAIRTLTLAGAKKFFVANAPDIGAIPESRLIGGRETARRATVLSKMFNRRLANAIENIEDDFDVEILEFDTFRFLRETIKKGGFTNSRDACFFTSVYFDLLGAGTPPEDALSQAVNPECGFNFDSFVFFDEIHPTAAVHALAGISMRNLVLDGDDDDDDDDG